MFETNNTQSGASFSSILSNNTIILAAAGIAALIFIILLLAIIIRKKKSGNQESTDSAGALQQNAVFNPMSAAAGYQNFPPMPDASQFPVYPQSSAAAPATQAETTGSELSSWGADSWDYEPDSWEDSPNNRQEDGAGSSNKYEREVVNGMSRGGAMEATGPNPTETEDLSYSYQSETYEPESYRPEVYKPETYKPAAYTHKEDLSYLRNDLESSESEQTIVAGDSVTAFSTEPMEADPFTGVGDHVKSVVLDNPPAEIPMPSARELAEKLTELTDKMDKLTFAMSALSESLLTAASSGRTLLAEAAPKSTETDSSSITAAAVEGEKPKRKRGRKKAQPSTPEDEAGKEA